ncbi:MAG: hypothetical protein GYB68_06125 [Chloroflexi bacterium]|nr:hypothetical protein [Chloroflexota bacterium]
MEISYPELLCKHCGSDRVQPLRTYDQLILRCENCGRELLRYMLDPTGRYARFASLPEDEKHEVIHLPHAETALLESLPDKARILYDFLRRYVLRHGYAPSQREIQQEFEYKALKSVQYYLELLDDVDLIDRDYAVSRGIRLKYLGWTNERSDDQGA